MFVDQTMGGALQKSLQQAEMVSYRVRMVESSGPELCRLLQLSLERPACYTCEQEGEELQKCRQRNVLYESMQQRGGRQEGG